MQKQLGFTVSWAQGVGTTASPLLCTARQGRRNRRQMQPIPVYCNTVLWQLRIAGTKLVRNLWNLYDVFRDLFSTLSPKSVFGDLLIHQIFKETIILELRIQEYPLNHECRNSSLDRKIGLEILYKMSEMEFSISFLLFLEKLLKIRTSNCRFCKKIVNPIFSITILTTWTLLT